MGRKTWTILLGILSLSLAVQAAEDIRGAHPRMSVAAPTRLDWIFPLANQSNVEPPVEWLKDYESTAQTYELFVPPRFDPKKPAAVLLFISPGDEPVGAAEFRKVCESRNIVFASPRAAGNDCPTPRRVRIVMDVLDDLRRRIKVDPDRTYIGGFSGGGRIACAIGFALPELFGGVVPVCAGGELRPESWLRRRVADRLNVALITGENDFNRGEVERFHANLLKGAGVEQRVWVVDGLGHGIPTGASLDEALTYLDDGALRRAKLAKTYSASRIAGDKAPTGTVWSADLLEEAKGRLNKPATLYSGLMQLQGISVRWAGLPAGKEAQEILEEYDARTERPWDEDDIAEQRRFLIARARALDAYVSGPLPAAYQGMEQAMLQAAVNLWKQVVEDGQDAEATREGEARLPELKKRITPE